MTLTPLLASGGTEIPQSGVASSICLALTLSRERQPLLGHFPQSISVSRQRHLFCEFQTLIGATAELCRLVFHVRHLTRTREILAPKRMMPQCAGKFKTAHKKNRSSPASR